MKSWGGYVIIMIKVKHVLCWHFPKKLKILTVVLYAGLSYVWVNKALELMEHLSPYYLNDSCN